MLWHVCLLSKVYVHWAGGEAVLGESGRAGVLPVLRSRMAPSSSFTDIVPPHHSGDANFLVHACSDGHRLDGDGPANELVLLWAAIASGYLVELWMQWGLRKIFLSRQAEKADLVLVSPGHGPFDEPRTGEARAAGREQTRQGRAMAAVPARVALQPQRQGALLWVYRG